MQKWLKNVVSQNERQECKKEKMWPPLTPPYDPDFLENDDETENEFRNSKSNSQFNKHGLGFDQDGNELFKKETNDKEKNTNNPLSGFNYDLKSSFNKNLHEEL